MLKRKTGVEVVEVLGVSLLTELFKECLKEISFGRNVLPVLCIFVLNERYRGVGFVGRKKGIQLSLCSI